MKDKDTQSLFESYLHSLEEGRKKQYSDRVRQKVVDPETGEERNETYYEMIMRIKGKGAGVRSKATRQRKEKRSNKVELGKREFKVAEKSYEERLNTSQRDVIRYVEADETAKASDILNFLVKTGMDKKEATTILGGMITDGYLDEVFANKEEPAVEPTTDKYVPSTAELDTDYDEPDDSIDDELEDI